MNLILLDIEGTTTPIDFVHKKLFPYAKQKIAGYIEQNFGDLAEEISQLKKEHSYDHRYESKFLENSPSSIANYLEFLIEIDRKSTPLKSIQGKIWKKGYEDGEIKGEVFAEVPKAFERWKAKGIGIAIFSSGSILAQKMLFQNSTAGDLSSYISGYFDTNIGPKGEAESYNKIAKELNEMPGEILFISDIPNELDAAKKAGFQTRLSMRPGNAPLREKTEHEKIRGFFEVE